MFDFWIFGFLVYLGFDRRSVGRGWWIIPLFFHFRFRSRFHSTALPNPPPINTPANLILSSSPRLPPRPRHDPLIQLKTLAHQTPSHLYGHSDACEESGQVCHGLQGVVGFATTVEAGSGRGCGGCWEGDGRRGEGVGFVCRWVGGWLVGVWGEDGGESSGFGG